MLDVLSLDEFSEWYKLSGAEIRQRFDAISILDLMGVEDASRLNLVGAIEPTDGQNGQILQAFLKPEEAMTSVADDASMIFAASDARKLERIDRLAPKARSRRSDLRVLEPLPARQSVLIVG